MLRRVLQRYRSRRWMVWLLLLVASWGVWPVIWSPLDQRFYNYFHSHRQVPAWSTVAVVGIDVATRETAFTPPVFPLSRHVEAHARLLERLREAGARAVVLDLTLRAVDFSEPPQILAEAMRTHGAVYLGMSLQEVRQRSPSGTSTRLTAVMPDSLLVAAARGVHVVDVQLDPDGVLRRFSPDPRLQRLGLTSLPEYLSNQRVQRPVPIVFPSLDRPLPVVSYRDALVGDRDALAKLKGRIVFVGLVEDPTTDFIAAPRLQDQGGGWFTGGLHGVVALAAITETLARGAPLRDATPLATLSWVVLWSFLVMALPPRRNPLRAGALTVGLVLVATLVTGYLHIQHGVIFSAGLLVGTLFVSGVHGMIVSYVETSRDLRIERLRTELMQRELQTARQTQERFLPREIPTIDGFDLWGINLSSAEVSGDYYDVIDTGPEGPLVLAIADVAGKGLPAALLMSNVQAGLHSHLLQDRFDLVRTVRNLNRLVHENVDPGVFVTMFLAEIDKPGRTCRYIRAGHDEPILIKADGSAVRLEKGSLFLGVLPDLTYEAVIFQLEPGDLLCLYTDGVTEAFSDTGEQFGVERMIGVLRARRHEAASVIGAALLSAVEDFSGLDRQADDLTLVLLRLQ